MSYVISIDQGTTGSTAVLLDADSLKFIDKENLEYRQIYPRPGWVEHDLNEIWKTVEETIKTILGRHKIQVSEIASIGITNQRETICAFRRDGSPLANAIVWQDRRTQDRCREIRDLKDDQWIQKLTGLPVDPYFSATKIEWLLKNNESVKLAASHDDLLLGTIDTFLLYRLTKAQSFRTEASNASRTLLMDINDGQWSSKLCDYFGISKKSLPEICPSFYQFGKTSGLSFLPDGIPITGILGDQQAALFGQAGHSKGSMKCTYGTGAFMLLNTGEAPVTSQNGLLTTVAFRHQDKLTYALEGSCYIAGAAVQWLRDNLNFIQKSPDVEELARRADRLDEMENILFLPFFTGIGSPYWVSEARGALIGLTRDTGRHHVARACLEGMALSINDLIVAMASDTLLPIKALNVDGGAVANDFLMEIQATISAIEIVRPKIIETTAYGAGLASLLGSGSITLSDIDQLWQQDRVFYPNKNASDYYGKKKSQWTHAIKRLYL